MVSLMKFSGCTFIISAICLGIWWFSAMFLFFYFEKNLSQNFGNYYLSNWSIISNIFQFLTVILIAISFGTIYFVFMGELKNLGVVLFCIIMTGSILMGGIAFYETFIWPVLAKIDVQILNLTKGPVYTNILFLIGFSIPLFLFVLNFILYGFAFWSLGIYPATALLSFVFGAVIFALGSLITPVRYYVQSSGVILLICGLIGTGLRNLHG